MAALPAAEKRIPLIFGAIGMQQEKKYPLDFRMFAEAWCCLAVARLMLVFMPFRKIVPVMRYKRTKKRDDDAMLLQRIKLAIARACVRSPWRTKCFEQALAAKMMTGRRGMDSVIYFGVTKEENDPKMQAHAWLKCGEVVVTGWQKLDKYKVVATF